MIFFFVFSPLPALVLLALAGLADARKSIAFVVPSELPAAVTPRCSGHADDRALASAVASRLHWNSHLEDDAIVVVVLGGIAELRGHSRSEVERALAERLARDTYGIIAVSNRLDVVVAAVAPPVYGAASLRLYRHIRSDPWITTTVRTTLGLSRGTDNCAVGVNAVGGVVMLSGNMGSVTARDLAIELAGATFGVRGVDAAALQVR